MEVNLENRPKYDGINWIPEGTYEERFKEFEKELREIKQNHSALLKVRLHTVLNEILGEK